MKKKYQKGWNVLTFAGWAKDLSKRSLKICSLDHLLFMTSNFTACRFGVISARTVKFIRRYHSCDGRRLFVYQPFRLAANLSIFYDADFLHPQGNAAGVNSGITCDLFLTPQAICEGCFDSIDHSIAALFRKWHAHYLAFLSSPEFRL